MITNELAIVTGGASGIGFNVVQRFVEANIKVVIIDRDASVVNNNLELQAMMESGLVDCTIFDCQDCKSVEKFVSDVTKQYGRIDILVNNVGGNTEKLSIDNLSNDYIKNVFDQNFYTALFMTRAVIPLMRHAKYGRIVNVSSIAGRTYSRFSNAAYVSAKAALIGLTKQLAFDEAKFNIAVNTVAHGPINTQRILDAWNRKTENEQSAIKATIPAARFGEVYEAAEAIVFLCSKGAGYCSGACIDVNGGMFI